MNLSKTSVFVTKPREVWVMPLIPPCDDRLHALERIRAAGEEVSDKWFPLKVGRQMLGLGFRV